MAHWRRRERSAGRHLAGEASLHGHPLVERLAREELERLAHDRLPAPDWHAAAARFQGACRTFGVVLAPAAAGLDRLDGYLYRPLRDACLLTVKLLEGEVAERTRAGAPLRAAFTDVIDSWLGGFGMLLVTEKRGSRPDSGFPSRVATVVTRTGDHRAYPPYSYPPHLVLLQRAEESAAGSGGAELARRMLRRGASFEACDADFQGAGGREVRRAVFVTALLLRDAVHSRARKVPPQSFTLTYREVLERYKVATAELVVGGASAARVRGRRGG